MKQLPEQFSVYAKTKEEAKYICEKQKEICGDTFDKPRGSMYYRFSPNQTWDRWGYNSTSYIHRLSYYNVQHEFTFEEFKSYFEEEFVLPEKVTKPYNDIKDITYEMLLNHPYFKKLTLEELEDVLNYVDYDNIYNVLKGNLANEKAQNLIKKWKNNMEKEIIGYKLIKPEYEAAALLLINETSFRDFNYGGRVDIQVPKNIAIFKKAGVLDLWFEPVYKDEKQDIILTLTNGKQVTVTKEGKIMAEGSEFNNIELRKLYARIFEPFSAINGLKITANSINIGCWKNIEARDLKLILETQEKQSK